MQAAFRRVKGADGSEVAIELRHVGSKKRDVKAPGLNKLRHFGDTKLKMLDIYMDHCVDWFKGGGIHSYSWTCTSMIWSL